jgi:uncharacterized protein YfkK (UPF0435 family)
MKFSTVLLSLLLLSGNSLFVVAQEEGGGAQEVEVDADGTTISEPPQEEAPSEVAINCDEICVEQVSAVKNAASVERETLEAQIRRSQHAIADAEQQIRDIETSSASSLEDVKRKRDDFKFAKQECDKEVSALKERLKEIDSLNLRLRQVEASLEVANKKTVEIAFDLFSAKQELDEYKQKLFHVNMKVLKTEKLKSLKDKAVDYLKTTVKRRVENGVTKLRKKLGEARAK